MKKILDSNTLKFIAITAMTVDHVAWLIFPGYNNGFVPVFLHIIGRLTCPIMCYFIAEGYYHTKNINKYTLRLFVFSFISHFAYIFASSDFVDLKSFIPFYYGDILNQTSVMWPLAWGLVMLRVVNNERIKPCIRVFLILLICLITFPSDWSCIASLCILAIGTNKGNFKKQMLWMTFYVAVYSVVYFFALDKLYGIIQMGVILAIPFIKMYNGKRGKSQRMNKAVKWLFYIYYPLHLFVIGCIQIVFQLTFCPAAA